MTTLSTAQLDRFADAWEDDCGYASAVCSGIVGDLAHRLRGGPHISIEDNPQGNYSIVRPDDKAPPGRWPRNRSTAVDMSKSTKDMVTCYGRVRRVYDNRADPRRRFFNAVNCWDGSGDAVRLDFVANTVSFATPDHKWHVHHEFRRRYVNDPVAMAAGVSMYRGDTVAQWLSSQATAPRTPAAPAAPLLPQENSMPRQVVPHGYAFVATVQTPTPGQVRLGDPAAAVSVPAEPVGAAGWSSPYKEVLLSFTTDAWTDETVANGVLLRVAVHNGKGWEVQFPLIKPGGRVSWRGAGKDHRILAGDLDGSNIVVGRVRRPSDRVTEYNPDGTAKSAGADTTPVTALLEIR